MKVTRTSLLHLFVTEQERVIRLINRIVGCRATAEDLAQDTLLRLWTRPLDSGDRSLIFRTAQNLAIDHLRERRVRHRYVRSQAYALEPHGHASLEAAGAAAQELELLLDALRGLPSRTQEIFLLNRIDGLPYTEIATRLGVSVSTVEKEIMRALDQCRLAVKDVCP